MFFTEWAILSKTGEASVEFRPWLKNAKGGNLKKLPHILKAFLVSFDGILLNIHLEEFNIPLLGGLSYQVVKR